MGEAPCTQDEQRPVNAPGRAAVKSVEPTNSPVPPFETMIVEDEAFQRQIGVQILKRCNASTVWEARDGETALDLIKAEGRPIDLLVCDLNMPGMDGLEFLRHMAELGHTNSVILCSALAPSIIRAAEIMAKSYGVRILGVVEKPLTLPKLMPLLLRHFAQTVAPRRLPGEPMPLNEIVSGIENRQFEPVFQPKVDIRSGALVGTEALMRWRHPTKGLVSPARFIPTMESHGLISEVTFDFIEDILKRRVAWPDARLLFPLSVNISVESLSDVSLADRLHAMTQDYGLPPGALTLEITETVAMTDLGASLETLTRCRMKGFELSIDDYGTGFSSMLQLTRLPISEIKIDQSFVTGATDQPLLQALIETSTTMARRLHLKTVAEGVESRDDWDIVQRLGCDIVQGYFIGKPMPGEQMAGWYDQWLETYKGL